MLRQNMCVADNTECMLPILLYCGFLGLFHNQYLGPSGSFCTRDSALQIVKAIHTYYKGLIQGGWVLYNGSHRIHGL